MGNLGNDSDVLRCNKESLLAALNARNKARKRNRVSEGLEGWMAPFQEGGGKKEKRDRKKADRSPAAIVVVVVVVVAVVVAIVVAIVAVIVAVIVAIVPKR